MSNISLEQINKELVPVEIKRKNKRTGVVTTKLYHPVHERLKAFRKYFPDHALITTILDGNTQFVTFKASIINNNGIEVATGHAQELASNGYINEFSHVENGETSAWGRALGNFGIGIDESIASADEVANAMKNQSAKKDKPKATTSVFKSDPTKELISKCKSQEDLEELYKKLSKNQQDKYLGCFQDRKNEILMNDDVPQ